MAAGLPFVTTPVGAEGLGLGDLEDVLVADDVRELARSQSTSTTIGVCGREFRRNPGARKERFEARPVHRRWWRHSPTSASHRRLRGASTAAGEDGDHGAAPAGANPSWAPSWRVSGCPNCAGEKVGVTCTSTRNGAGGWEHERMGAVGVDCPPPRRGHVQRRPALGHPQRPDLDRDFARDVGAAPARPRDVHLDSPRAPGSGVRGQGSREAPTSSPVDTFERVSDAHGPIDPDQREGAGLATTSLR